LTVEVNRTSIAEDAGPAAATLTVRRSGPASNTDTVVTLASSNPANATVPSTVIISAGQTFVTVNIAVIDNDLLDGTRSITFTASGNLLASGTAMISVTDRETLTAVFSSPAVREDAAPDTFFLRITRSNTDRVPLVLTIIGNVPTEITFPTTVTIPADSDFIRIPVLPINDTDAERPLDLVYTITAPGYGSVQANLRLNDDEPPKFQNPLNRFNADGRGDVLPIDALRVINALSRRRGNAELNPDTDSFVGLFPDVSGDYAITPLDALLVINEIARRRREQTATPIASPEFSSREELQNDAVIDAMTAGPLF